MAISIQELMGSKDQTASKKDLPKAQLWMNVGYNVPVEVRDSNGNVTKEDRFISLPLGIPLDTMEKRPTNKGAEEFRMLCAAQNNLLEKLVEAGMKLPAGEFTEVNLTLQIRRVKADEAPISNDVNPLIPENLKF